MWKLSEWMGGVSMNNENRASAPYNFIPFEKFTVKATEDLTSHDRFYTDRKTGKITYTFKNETEIFVGGNKEEDAEQAKHFFSDDDNYIIPGSTMRGFVRANAEILSLSYPDMIEDRRMMYRSFADKCISLRKQYAEKMRGGNDDKRTSLKQSIRAGYLYWENEHKLCIVPAKDFAGRGCNYVSIHESDLRKIRILQNEKQYMYTKQIPKMRECRYGDISKFDKEKLYRETLKPFTKHKYEPYGNQPFHGHAQVLQFAYDGAHITGLQEGNYKGFLFNSQWLYGKVNHYLINQMSQSDIRNAVTKYVIDNELVQSYEKDLEIRKQQNKTLVEQDYFYNLPYENGAKKIGVKYAKIFFFRTDQDGRVSDFGPTPYFRTFYQHSIREAIPTKPLSKGYDFVSSVFGFIQDKAENKEVSHYEGRVNFMNCILPKAEGKETEKPCDVVLMGPKPTSFQLYLVQKKDNIRYLQTYNGNPQEMELRGRKFYWKKDEVEKPEVVDNKNVGTKFYPLEQGQHFRGEIYFENLTEAELGLILCALQIDKDDSDNIGQGKPYGFGRIMFENIEVFYEDKAESFLNLDAGYREAWVEKFPEFKDLLTVKWELVDAIHEILDSSAADDERIAAIKGKVMERYQLEEVVDEDLVEKMVKLSRKEKEEEDKQENEQENSSTIIDRFLTENETKMRRLKMQNKVEALKENFCNEMNCKVKNYAGLKSIETYRNVKSSVVKDCASYRYMKLTDFKKRFVLEEANELLHYQK